MKKQIITLMAIIILLLTMVPLVSATEDNPVLLKFDSTYDGSISSSKPSDYFTFTVSQQGTLMVNFSHDRNDYGMSLYIRDARGNMIVNYGYSVASGHIDGETWRFGQFGLRDIMPGTYYVEVARGGTVYNYFGSYSFIIDFIPTGGNIRHYLITAKAGKGGTVTGSGIYQSDERVTLTAIPNSGWRFDGWYEQEARVSGISPWSFDATLDRVIEARFIEGTSENNSAPKPNLPSSWAVIDVNEAITLGLVPLSFRTDYTSQITRAEFCELAVMLYEKHSGGEITHRSSFDDTDDVHAEKMASIGVVSGVGDNRFNPDGLLTREQAAAIITRLANACGKPLTKQTATFSDLDSVASWAIESIGQVQAEGIMTGVGANKFAPKSQYTREQSIITLLRLYDLIK